MTGAAGRAVPRIALRFEYHFGSVEGRSGAQQSRPAATLAGMLLGGGLLLDWPLSWMASIFFFAGAVTLRTARPVTGGEETEGQVVAQVARSLPPEGRRGPARAERIRYRARGLDGVVRDFEVVDSLASSRPAPVGTTRRVSYHPAAPADGRVLHPAKRLIGWWFVVGGLWVLVLMNLSAALVPLTWVVVSAVLCLAYVLWGPSSHVPAAPPPNSAWRPPPPSWPEGGDAHGLAPGLRLHLNRVTLTTAATACGVSAVTVAVLQRLL